MKGILFWINLLCLRWRLTKQVGGVIARQHHNCHDKLEMQLFFGSLKHHFFKWVLKKKHSHFDNNKVRRTYFKSRLEHVRPTSRSPASVLIIHMSLLTVDHFLLMQFFSLDLLSLIVLDPILFLTCMFSPNKCRSAKAALAY